MKMISWNVNGLRAVLKKGFCESVAALDADIICLQETKLQKGQCDLELPGYVSAFQLCRPQGLFGHGGVLARAARGCAHGHPASTSTTMKVA